VPTINQLTAINLLSSSDLVPVYSQVNGDARKASMTAIANYVKSTITVADDKITQYAAPVTDGQVLQVTDGPSSVWVITTPLSVFAAGTVRLPAVANCVDRQEVLVNYTNGVTALTVDGNGAAAVFGAPSTMASNSFFRLRFDATMKTWYRVG
jgi:hypothetical protein